MRRRAFLLVAALAALATTAAACLSPTLPLPPPEPESVASVSGGQWQISGNCIPGAEVIVLDVKSGVGVVVEDLQHTGVFSVKLTGSACDPVSITQDSGGADSAEASVLLQPYQNGFPVDPSACN